MAKKLAKKNDQNSTTSDARRDQSAKGSVDFPKHTLEDALRVAEVLEDKNSGNPLPPTDVAIGLGKSPGSSEFRMLLSSAIRYGLTEGSYNQPRISLQESGRNIVEPKSPEERTRALIQATLKPEVFRKIFEAYKNKKLPDMQFFCNTLVRDFSIARDQAERCAQIFFANVEKVGLVKQATTGKWLSDEAAPAAPPASAASVQAGTTAEEEIAAQETAGVTIIPKPAVLPQGKAGLPQDVRLKRVFVTHGKNKAFIDPIKKLLAFGEFGAVIAAERESVSQPVPDKVMNDMRSCGAAIIHVEDELRLMDKDTNEHIVLNPNVLIEIGAAMALYGRRFILLVKEGVKMP
jgi:hypothetical protein